MPFRRRVNAWASCSKTYNREFARSTYEGGRSDTVQRF